MKPSRLTLIVIIILVLAGGGWVYADKAKQQAVDEAVSEALRDNALLLEMLGLQIQYADLDTSIFNNAVTFRNVSINRRLSSAGTSSVQELNIDALTVDQNLPMFELEEAVDEQRIPTEFSLVVEGLNMTSAFDAMQRNSQLSPMFKHILLTASEQRENNMPLKSDMQFAYELEAGRRGERDGLQIDFGLALRDMGEISMQSKFQDVNTQFFALLNLANTAQLKTLHVDYNGNAKLNKAVMVALAREAGNDVTDYSEVADQLLKDLQPRPADQDSWESRQLTPAVETFIKNPKGLKVQIEPTTPMTLNRLMRGLEYREEAVLEGVTLEAY